MKSKLLVAALALGMATSAANAATYTFTAGEFNGDGDSGPALIASWDVILGAGESIVSAVFSSTWGTPAIPNSADGFVTVGGVTVGTCTDAEDCYNAQTPTALTYAFASGEFASLLGPIDLIYNQANCCVIRFGASTLTIETSASTVPVPAAGALMIPVIGSLVALRRRQRKNRA